MVLVLEIPGCVVKGANERVVVVVERVVVVVELVVVVVVEDECGLSQFVSGEYVMSSTAMSPVKPAPIYMK